MRSFSRPVLTVAIPTYNGGAPLLQAVESCKYISLSREEFEVLIVDNCSTDGSLNQVKKQFSKQLPLRIVKNDSNVGRIGNWNRCLELAKGEFLMFLFTSDLVAKINYVNKAVNLLKKYSNSTLITTTFLKADFNLKNIYHVDKHFALFNNSLVQDSHNTIQYCTENGRFTFVPLQTNIFRLTFIKYYNLKFCNKYPIQTDGLFTTELVLKDNIFLYLNKANIIWRNAPNRLHNKCKLDKHVSDGLKAFSIINHTLLKNYTNIEKSYANYPILEYIYSDLIANQDENKNKIIFTTLKIWFRHIKNERINYLYFIKYFFINMINLFVKLIGLKRSLFTLIKK